MLDADVSVIAVSGVGVHQACWGGPSEQLGTYYGRALQSNATEPYDFTSWLPDLVVVCVGGNDLYGGKTAPSEGDFVNSYSALLKQIREKRPEAVIQCVVYSL